MNVNSYCYYSPTWAEQNPDNLKVNKQLKDDFEVISGNKEEVISGFLSLGEKDGLKEGLQYAVGVSFVRYYMNKFWHVNRSTFSDYGDIFRKTINTYFSPIPHNKELNFTPSIMLDCSLTGWEKHAVSRMVGNLSSNKNSKGPFFELLINSQRAVGEKYGFPYRVYIFENDEVLTKRWQTLKLVQNVSADHAKEAYYSTNSMTIEKYVYGKNIGPNAKRLLGGLKFIDGEVVKNQTVGNCWMKQPKRTVLISLFIQILVDRKELSMEESYKLAKMLYGKWKQFVTSELKGLLNSGGVRKDLIPILTAKINSKVA